MFEKIGDLTIDSKKINFRGEKISKLEANILKLNLKLGLMDADLNEEEKKQYTLLKKSISSFKIKNKELSEKEYLIGELSSKIKIAELAEKIEYCEKHGHIHGSENTASGAGGTKVYGFCKRCGSEYARGLSVDEWDNFNRMMNTPFNI